MEIKKISFEKLEEALELTLKTFLEYEASDYTEEGILEYKQTSLPP